jgi:anti-anti-sigma regulatory factor
VGIFSFLKNKHGTAGPIAQPLPDADAARERQREIARATAAKIDEIELEMAAAIFDDDAWSGGRRVPAAADIPELTDILHDAPDDAAGPTDAQAVEEAALLYANGQLDAAERILLTSLADAGRTDRLPWRMLLDLYQIAGREADFDDIAIDYASRFETSPPAYQAPADAAFTGVTPTASLDGPLDAGIREALTRVLAPSPSPVVRFEFGGVTGATARGCTLLVAALQQLRRDGRELVLVGTDRLTAVLRPLVIIGERNASQAPWLLLLELLLLMNREKDFEQTAMDYCITFDLSPPSFERPPRAALSLDAGPVIGGDRFLLPGVVDSGDVAGLLAAIDAHAARPSPLVLDCSRLVRIDVAAANALGARLRTLAGEGSAAERAVTLRDLNHLVAPLLRLLGIGANAHLATRK